MAQRRHGTTSERCSVVRTRARVVSYSNEIVGSARCNSLLGVLPNTSERFAHAWEQGQPRHTHLGQLAVRDARVSARTLLYSTFGQVVDEQLKQFPRFCGHSTNDHVSPWLGSVRVCITRSLV